MQTPLPHPAEGLDGRRRSPSSLLREAEASLLREAEASFTDSPCDIPTYEPLACFDADLLVHVSSSRGGVQLQSRCVAGRRQTETETDGRKRRRTATGSDSSPSEETKRKHS